MHYAFFRSSRRLLFNGLFTALACLSALAASGQNGDENEVVVPARPTDLELPVTSPFIGKLPYQWSVRGKVSPSIPVRLTGYWPLEATKLEIRVYLKRTAKKSTAKKSTANDSTVNKSTANKSILQEQPDFTAIVLDRAPDQTSWVAPNAFTPGFYNRYSLAVIAYDTVGKVVATTMLNSGEFSQVYAGDLSPFTDVHWSTFSSIGNGVVRFRGVDSYSWANPIITIGIIWNPAPFYPQLRKPYVHFPVRKGTRLFSWAANRYFIGGGVTASPINYKGREVTTSAIKGTVVTGLFLAPGLGLAYSGTYGRVKSPRPAFDNTTKGFWMSGISLVFTGDLRRWLTANKPAVSPPAGQKSGS